MKLRLEESVSSPQDLKAVILEIRDYARWFSHNSVKRRLNLKAKRMSDEPVVSSAAAALLREWNTKTPLSQKSLDQLLATLKDFEDTAPQLTITLAAPPAGGLKKTLVAWCRENIAPNVLVNFQFNSTLLGGMVVRSGSRVFDWSFRRQILEARQNFPEVLRRV
jgi:hypothetical protein